MKKLLLVMTVFTMVFVSCKKDQTISEEVDQLTYKDIGKWHNEGMYFVLKKIQSNRGKLKSSGIKEFTESPNLATVKDLLIGSDEFSEVYPYNNTVIPKMTEREMSKTVRQIESIIELKTNKFQDYSNTIFSNDQIGKIVGNKALESLKAINEIVEENKKITDSEKGLAHMRNSIKNFKMKNSYADVTLLEKEGIDGYIDIALHSALISHDMEVGWNNRDPLLPEPYQVDMIMYIVNWAMLVAEDAGRSSGDRRTPNQRIGIAARGAISASMARVLKHKEIIRVTEFTLPPLLIFPPSL